MVEIPEAKKCCFCLPLRRGLLALVYFKLMAGVGLTLFLMFFTMILIAFHVLDHFLTAVAIVTFTILITSIFFDTLFIASAHMKNVTSIRIYYRYLVAQLGCYLVVLVAYVPCTVLTLGTPDNVPEAIAEGVGVILILILLHVYFMYLVRSELKKLELSTLFSFKSQIDESDCSVQILG